MGYLAQPSTVIADCNKFTISFWVNFPTSAICGEFGFRPAYSDTPEPLYADYLDASWITVDSTGVSVNICSSLYDKTQWYGGNPGGNDFELVSASAQNRAAGRVSASMPINVWHHVLVAWDSSQDSSFIIGSYVNETLGWTIPLSWNTLKVAVDGIVREENSTDAGDRFWYSTQPTQGFPISTTVPVVTSAPKSAHFPYAWLTETPTPNAGRNDGVTVTGASTGPYPFRAGGGGFWWQDSRPAAINVPENPAFVSGIGTIPAWDVKISDRELGFPWASYDVPYSSSARYAEVQMWFGQYIDPATHISKFIDARRKPVDPAIPAAAFGPPTVRFRRNKTKHWEFSTNQGSGGPFTKVGTIADFRPGPEA